MANDKNLSYTLSQSQAVLDDLFKKIGVPCQACTKPLKVVFERISLGNVSMRILEDDDNKSTDVSSAPVAEPIKKPSLDEAVAVVRALSERDRATLTVQLLNSIGAFKNGYDMNDISHILMQSIGNGDFPCPSHLDE